MLRLSIVKAKVCLVILCLLIALHAILLSTKIYRVSFDQEGFLNFTEEQYLIYLSSNSTHNNIGVDVDKTKVYYLFDLPKESILVVYLGYFIVATTLILSVKYNPEKLRNEN